MLEAAFARLVEQWEGYFAPLAVAYQPVEPPASVKTALDRRLFAIGGARAEHAASAGLWSSLAFWRGAGRGSRRRLRASMSPCRYSIRRSPSRRRGWSPRWRRNGSDVSYLAVYDAAPGEVALSHVSGERGAGQDFELWMVEGQNAPVSMGVIPAGDDRAARRQARDQGQARQGRRARHQPRAGGRLAHRPAHDRRGCRRPPEHLANTI